MSKLSKIIIQEIDNTKSPIGAYGNFTVLVPGYWDSTSRQDPFGDMFAIEFNSQADFVEKIGKMPAEAQEAVKCKLTPLAFNTDETRVLPAGITYYAGIAHEETAGGYLDTGLMTFTSFVSDGYGSFTAANNIYIFARADDPDPDRSYAEGAFSSNTLGRNATPAGSYGNQFAYELLGLGYTVLYADLAKLKTAYTTEGSLFKEFEDRSAYEFRYILNGYMDGTYNADAANLAEARGDCIALCDLNATATGYNDPTLITMAAKVAKIKDLAEATTAADKYTALFANRPTYNMEDDQVYNNKTFAGGFHYLACAAKAAQNYAEWYAVAGYTRGVSPFAIDKLDINLGDAAVELLQARHGSSTTYSGISNKAVNIMVKIRGQYLLWGNRTAETLDPNSDPDQDTLKASHFLNIRQLCTTIKKQLYINCRRLTFNPNSDLLWSDFVSMIAPTLDKMKADQGLTDYKITRIQNSRKAMLTANLRIVPIEAVEDFNIKLYLEDSISGIVMDEDESEN